MAQSLYRQASLIMNPYGAKDDLLPSIKPTDGSGDFTFSRDGAGASPATRVNASGLIEKGRENIIIESQRFNLWSLNGAASVDADVTTAPDGTTTADRLNMTNSGAGVYSVPSVQNGYVYTQSIYIKNDSNCSAIRIGSDAFPSTAFVDYNAVTNSIITNGGAIISSSVEDAGGGWYRVSWSYVSTGIINSFIIYSQNASAQSCFIWAAQQEEGLVATDYIETTTAPVSAGLLGDMPRLDYSGGASCPSLLLEPSRVNLVPNSEYFSASEYTLDAITATANATTSPEGIANATEITRTSASGNARLILSNRVVSSGAKVTISIFAKANTASDIILYNTASTQGKRFDLSTGTAGDDFVNAPDDFDIEDYGNGWYRCWIVVTAPSTTMNSWIYIVDSDTSSVYMYGQQMEEASYPTSYIPTYGSASTRGDDDAIVNYTDINDTEGTIFWQGSIEYAVADGHAIALSNSSGAVGANRILLYRNVTDGNYYIYIQGSGSSQYSTPRNLGVSSTSDNDKFAIAYANNDLAVYVNGTQVYTSSSGSVPNSMEYIQLNEWNNDHTNKNITKQSIWFPTRLTNAELAALTA